MEHTFDRNGVLMWGGVTDGQTDGQTDTVPCLVPAQMSKITLASLKLLMGTFFQGGGQCSTFIPSGQREGNGYNRTVRHRTVTV